MFHVIALVSKIEREYFLTLCGEVFPFMFFRQEGG